MPKVVVAYHSGYGHTKLIAEHVAKGAASVAGVTASAINVADLPGPNPDRSYPAQWNELNSADAIIFGCPTYMGDVSWQMKKFMEDASGIWFTQGWKDKLAAGFSNSGGLSGDKLQTVHTLSVFAGQHSMIWVSTGVMPSAYTGDGKNLNRLSSFSGLMTQSGQGAPEASTDPADRLTAEAFGKRVAEAAVRWAKGR
jgi:NAD(P)H dehydrogenase (quinone)